MNRARSARRASLAGVALATLLASAVTAGSAVSVKNGKLLFVARWDLPGKDGGVNSIWTMNANGSGKNVLTPHVGSKRFGLEDSEPDWSPNGTEIAFTRARHLPLPNGGYGLGEGVTEIDVMNANGSGQRRLTRSTVNDHSPAWSPDAKRIAFARDRPRPLSGGGDLMSEIYVMNANGSGLTRLTQVVVDGCSGDTTLTASQPTWSPDGTKIAFTGKDVAYPCNDEIYVMNADGTAKTPLTGNGASASRPAWSPDGTKIAYQSENLDIPYTLRASTFEIYVMNADGSGQTRLTKNDNYCPYGCPNGETHVQPAWSPDGTKIAFTRHINSKTIDQYERYDLFVMNADGSGRRPLMRNLKERVDWGPVPTGAPNPLPPVRITVHPSLTLRCLRGSGTTDVVFQGQISPVKGIGAANFFVNGKDIFLANQPPLIQFGVYTSQLPKTATWTVKAIVYVTAGESEATLVLTKKHAGHC